MRDLFGGSIVCNFPQTYMDVSHVREIPDNEEVFYEDATDSCLVVDLLEYAQEVSDDHVAEYQFQDIAEGNEVKSFQILETGKISIPQPEGPNEFRWCCGIQNGIVKFREHETRGNDVKVWVAVQRLKHYNTDIVISVTAPIRLSEQSSSYVKGSVPDVENGKRVFELALATFKVLDYNLFA
jgi:Ran-interacting Mog1 protein